MENDHKSESENKAQQYVKMLKDGCILLSHEDLEDPNFKCTVILICVYNNEGTFGLVLNRPSHMPLSEVFDVEQPYIDQKRPIYIGGPVDPYTIHVIQITDQSVQFAHPVSERVYLGGKWESLGAILSEDNSNTRIFLGYSGWGSEQLENEVLEGVWEVYQVNVEQLLRDWEEPLAHSPDAIRQYLRKNSPSVKDE